MFKRTGNKSSQLKKASKTSSKQPKSEPGRVREFVCRPVFLVALAMAYSYMVLVWMPAKLTHQQVINATTGALLVAGVCVSFLMYRRARAVSMGTDKSGFLELGGSFVAIVASASAAVYVFVYGYTGFEVLRLAAVCVAIAFASRLSTSDASSVSSQRSRKMASVDMPLAEFFAGEDSSDLVSDFTVPEPSGYGNDVDEDTSPRSGTPRLDPMMGAVR